MPQPGSTSVPSARLIAIQAVSFTLIGIAAFVIAARIYLRLKIQRRRLQASDLLMMAAWCAAVSTASFDVFFYVNGILRADINYTLVNYDADAETFEYILRVRCCLRLVNRPLRVSMPIPLRNGLTVSCLRSCGEA